RRGRRRHRQDPRKTRALAVALLSVNHILLRLDERHRAWARCRFCVSGVGNDRQSASKHRALREALRDFTHLRGLRSFVHRARLVSALLA
ncbi:MAG TPA: hypothetical protein VFQ61_23390, partial [Polyangiaceae bacterium]|nr:hypothetical protein [Polyangiaceae bacterium]